MVVVGARIACEHWVHVALPLVQPAALMLKQNPRACRALRRHATPRHATSRHAMPPNTTPRYINPTRLYVAPAGTQHAPPRARRPW